MSGSNGDNEERTFVDVLDEMKAEFGSEVLNVSTWNSPKHDRCLRKCFKTCRRVMPCDDFISHTMFGGLRYRYDEACIALQGLLKYAQAATKGLNTTERQLFERADGGKSLQFLKLLYQNLGAATAEHFEDPHLDYIAQNMPASLSKWMDTLVKYGFLDPSINEETTYLNVFAAYMRAFNIHCLCPGLGLKIPNKDGKNVESTPDILFSTPNRPNSELFSGVVEVKHLMADPEFRHVYTEASTSSGSRGTKGIIKTGKRKMSSEGAANDDSNCGQGPSHLKKSCVNIVQEDGPVSPKSSKSTDNKQSPEAKKTVSFSSSHYDDYDGKCDESNINQEPNMPGSPLTSSQQALTNEFFSQLLGSVIAMEHHLQPKSHSPLMGIGVVGFKVTFCAFVSNRHMKILEVPENKDARLEVYMTRPLNLLLATDRSEINQILLHMASSVKRFEMRTN